MSEEVAQLIGLSTPPPGTVGTTGRVPRLAFAERMREAAELETETSEAAYFGMLADRATQDIADDHRLVLLINDEVTLFMACPAAAASAVGSAR